MLSLTQIIFFSGAALLLLIIPGPSVLFITAQAMDGERKGSFVAILGLAMGDLVQVLAAASGLAVIVAASHLLFSFVAYVGAAYLFWLAYSQFRKRKEQIHIESEESPYNKRRKRLFIRALLVNALNPKSTLFFLAFLPTFVEAGRGMIVTQILSLGIIFVLMGLCTNSIWAWLSHRAVHLIQSRSIFMEKQHYITAGIFGLLGIMAIVSGSRHR